MVLFRFKHRWRESLSFKFAQNISENRAAACSKKVVDNFFDLLTRKCEELNLKNKPKNIFNVDETGFMCSPGNKKMFFRRGSSIVEKIGLNNDKTMYTVQVCCDASGEFLPFYILFKSIKLWGGWCNGGPDNCYYNCSTSGWMERPHFFEWFQKVFVTHCESIEGPKLLILDGHASHINPTLVELAIEKNIHLLCLPAHTSHLLQPLDVAVFKPVKTQWKKIVVDFYQKYHKANLDKVSFPPLLRTLTEKAFRRSHAVAGFESTG